MIEDSFVKIASILFSSGLFFLANLVKRFTGSWCHPAALFALVWGFFTVIPMIAIYPAPVNLFAVLYIIACVFIFAIPALVIGCKGTYLKFRDNEINRINHLNNFNTKFIFIVLLVSSGLGVLFCFWTMLINGWILSDLLFDLLATSGRFAALRGNEGVEYGLVGSLGVLFAYLPASLGGLMYVSRKDKITRAIIIFLALMPAVLIMVIQSSKLIFLIGFCFFTSGILINNLYILKDIKFNKSILKIILKIFICILPFVLISFISREHYGDLDDLSGTLIALRYAMASYALGQIYAFSDFFAYYIGMNSVSSYNQDYFRFGAYTFSSIAEIFGANIDFPPGLYLETGWYKDTFETNVFTFFRGVILDFGIIGSLILFFILGLISHFIFVNILSFKNKIFANLFYMHTVVFLILTYLFSVFMARYMYLNFFALAVILSLNYKFSKFKYNKGKLCLLP